MTILSANQLEVGMITVANIRTPNGQILAEEGTVLTKQLINRIKLYSIAEIVVEIPPELSGNPVAEAVPAEPIVAPVKEPVVSEPAPMPEPKPEPKTEPKPEPVELNMKHGSAHNPTYTQKLTHSPEFRGFQMDYYLLNEKIKQSFHSLIDKNEVILYDEMLADIQNLFRNAQTTLKMFDLLHHMRSITDTTYAHCLNVALVCRTIGRWLHLEDNDLNVLTMAGLYHDLGKAMIPSEILDKPDRLTDEEFAIIKTHTTKGYQVLHNTNLDSRIAKAALMHHERCDGSGYPSGYKEEALSDFAMIVAIADVYDAMTAARSYRSALCPFQVIDSIEKEGYAKYNTKFLLTFLGKIASTYQANRVLLNDARGGMIVMLNQKHLSRPLIQLDDNTVIDLAAPENKDIFIKSIM